MQTVVSKAYQGRIVKLSAPAEVAAPQAAAEIAEAAADVERIRAEAEVPVMAVGGIQGVDHAHTIVGAGRA
ncbi:MAG: hypothetical protein KDJ16_00375, partial [Hyphomicrobiales bacterium]|nr:hypothetical protein [Hyphomicrobiales bacterium]